MDNILLRGIVGSTAYGLSGPESDVDELGIFAEETKRLVLLTIPDDTYVTDNPDLTLHEAGKYVRLALRCNPTILELMWLPASFYTKLSRLGMDLREMRSEFLSAKMVRNAYLGYATQQFSRLSRTGRFESTYRARTAKHARHVFRLLYQGFGLYSTGELIIQLPNPEEFHAFGEMAADDPVFAGAVIKEYEEKFNTATSVLPEEPNLNAAQDWLLTVREKYWR